MLFRQAKEKDLNIISKWDQHISQKELEISIYLNRVYIAEDKGQFIGWLRYNLFWDQIPFMNMLYLLEDYRGKGIGSSFVTYWEKEIKEMEYKSVMTSTVSNEYAQHFYYNLGYTAIGGFILQEEPYEIILQKKL